MANGRSQVARKKTVHSTLQTIDNYLWSQRPATFAPQIQACEMLEQKVRFFFLLFNLLTSFILFSFFYMDPDA
jgi:hypothetical protein